MLLKITQLLKNPILQNFFYLILDKVGRLGNFIVILLIARQYDLMIFGEFTYALTFTSILSSFIDLGIKNILIKNLIIGEYKKEDLLGSSFILLLVTSIGCILVSVIFVTIIQDTQLIERLILLFCIGFLFKPFTIIFYFFESKLMMKKVVPLTIINIIFFLFIKSAVFILYKPIIYFGYISILEAGIETIILIVLYNKYDRTILSWGFNFTVAKKTFTDSMPLFFSGAMIILYMRVDQILLKNILHNNGLLGQYSLAVKIVEGFYILPGAIISSWLPNLVSDFSTSVDKLNYNLQSKLKYLSGVSYVICISIFLLSDSLLTLFMGKNIESSLIVLKVLSFSIFFVSFGILQNAFLNIINHNIVVFISTFVGLLVNIILLYSLVTKYGIVGAALATLATHFVILVIPVFIRDTKHFYIFIFNAFIRPSFKLK